MLSRMSPVIRRWQEPAVCESTRWSLQEMIREGLLMVELDLDLSVRFARRSFGDTFPKEYRSR